MLRIPKLRCCWLSRITRNKSVLSQQRNGPPRLYQSVRYQSSHDGGGGSAGRVLLYTIGSLGIAAGGTIGYAAFDPTFRHWLEDNVPLSLTVLDFILPDEAPQKPKEKIKQVSTKPVGPSPAARLQDKVVDSSLLQKKLERDAAKLAETTTAPPLPLPPPPPMIEKEIKPPPAPEAADKVASKAEKPLTAALDATALNKKINELEKDVIASSVAAAEVYERAVKAVKAHTKEVVEVVESSVDKLGDKVWPNIEKARTAEEAALKVVEEKNKEARDKIEELKKVLSEKAASTSPCALSAKENMNQALFQLEACQAALLEAQSEANLTERYKEMVAESREHFENQLAFLIPSVKIGEKSQKLTDSELNLFVLHAYKNVLYYQKELSKLETLGQEKLRAALEARGESSDSELTSARLRTELERQRRDLELDFQKKSLQLKEGFEKELRTQLRRQAAAHSDHLQDVMTVQEREIERRFARELEDRLAVEHAQYKTKMAAMMGRLRGIDTALKEKADSHKAAKVSQGLWSASEALQSSLKAGPVGLPWQEQLRPLLYEINAVKRAAESSDPVVPAVVSAIPKEAVIRGVFPENALRERFIKVERLALRLALVDERGSSLPVYFLSFLQSFLFVRSANKIPHEEIVDEAVDMDALDTYDILLRARYWLDRGNFTQTLRYMNLLRGAPRYVAKDWMAETRILLETKQAADVLMAHASNLGTHSV